MRRPTWPSEVRRNRQRLEATTIRLVALRKKVVFMLLKITKAHYEEYLKTEHWVLFALKIRKERKNCQDCGISAEEARKRDRQNLNVHHLTYERIGHELPEDVVAICRYCHAKRHGCEGIYELAQSKSMARITQGSQQACEICGILNGPTYYNVDEVLPVWVCSDCRM